jgi:hypothetical protein
VRHGAHNKSDILLVSSTFADPGSPVFTLSVGILSGSAWLESARACSPDPRGPELSVFPPR